MNNLIKSRIQKGAFWLITNSSSWCKQYKKKYDHKKYVAHLKLYESLVNSAKAQGIDEEDCLKISSDLKVSEMSDDMVVVYLCGKEVKSRFNTNTKLPTL